MAKRNRHVHVAREVAAIDVTKDIAVEDVPSVVRFTQGPDIDDIKATAGDVSSMEDVINTTTKSIAQGEFEYEQGKKAIRRVESTPGIKQSLWNFMGNRNHMREFNRYADNLEDVLIKAEKATGTGVQRAQGDVMDNMSQIFSVVKRSYGQLSVMNRLRVVDRLNNLVGPAIYTEGDDAKLSKAITPNVVDMVQELWEYAEVIEKADGSVETSNDNFTDDSSEHRALLKGLDDLRSTLALNPLNNAHRVAWHAYQNLTEYYATRSESDSVVSRARIDKDMMHELAFISMCFDPRRTFDGRQKSALEMQMGADNTFYNRIIRDVKSEDLKDVTFDKLYKAVRATADSLIEDRVYKDYDDISKQVTGFSAMYNRLKDSKIPDEKMIQNTGVGTSAGARYEQVKDVIGSIDDTYNTESSKESGNSYGSYGN